MNKPLNFSPRPLRLLLFYLLIFTLHSGTTYAQHRYHLSLGMDLPLLGTGVAGTTASILLRNINQPLTSEDIRKLNASDIFTIDQSAAHYYRKEARIASNVLLTASYGFPLTTLLLKDARADAHMVGVMLAETILLNETLTGITKALIKRPRPFTYNQDVPEDIKIERASNFSFFSGHTSYTATLSFFTAKVISDHTDNNALKAVAWSGAILWPAATGYMRYKAGMHFPTDVIVGYLVGAGIGYFIPQLHKVRPDKNTPGTHARQLLAGPNVVHFTLLIPF